MESRTITIPDITCGHCVRTITNELLDLEGVVEVEGDPEAKRVTIRWRPPATWEEIAEFLEEIGYPPADETA